MEATPAAKERNELFQRLKPCCVKASQLAIREPEDPKSHQELQQLIKQILDILNEQISTNPLALDEKLAEYVSFPLSHIFRHLERYPMSLVEDCVRCLTILIVHGWKSRISAKLVQQLFSFLIFIIDGVPGSPKRDVPEEAVLEALRAETALLTTAGSSPVAAAGLSEPESIPVLGHGITVILDGVSEGATPEIQREALRTLEALYGAIKEHAALASFLPGTISSLAKVLSKPTRYKKLVIAKCLGTTQVILTKVLSDMRTRSILAIETESQTDADKSKVLSPAWLKATVAQVQVALSVMMKLRTYEGSEVPSVTQMTAYWLCFELVKAAHTHSEYTDALFDLSAFNDQSDDINEVYDELYDFSVQLLDSHTETGETDWRLEAIALEIMAYAAHRSGEKFRPELIDVLFPVATLLGSDDGNLQQHAIAALNSIALSCQYSGVSELIIDNVDYMVNSVSLRLNTLDISPASTQVMKMMVRLAGPRLVPFLDDVVESMFAALENYHGYASFVESLFSVLKEIVDQAAKADGRLLTDVEQSPINHKKQVQKMEDLETLLEILEKRKEREERDRIEMENMATRGGHPGVPWTNDLAQGVGNEDDQAQAEPPRDEERPPNSPTYQPLQRVASLTQHYLTSPTPTLRRSLLELLTTAASVLAADEDSFLPLVNAIWPVVIARLHDSETFIVIEACETLSGLCKAAGDFLATRWKTEWGDGLRDWCRKIKQQASRDKGRSNMSSKGLSQSMPGKEIVIPIRSSDSLEVQPMSVKSAEPSGGLGQHASPARIWEAVVKLLTAIISYVRVEDEMFDEILDLLADAMERNQEVREALEVINADAVWAVRYERGLVESIPAPVLEGVVFPEMGY
ncbi:TEL2-interacting protein 1 [Trichoderma asperellum]|uniref:TEL2-interacting protein 1 n=1 Tax=Trichoderma asperellum TaxID=101201 RepID=A0A6V8R8Z6_TRIAP|nr:TEL2-interacting protein 1 [Trichoderma asperellum]